MQPTRVDAASLDTNKTTAVAGVVVGLEAACLQPSRNGMGVDRMHVW